MIDNIVLEAVTGSRAYGLNHAESDTDKMGIFVADTLDVAGLSWGNHKETWSDAGPTGDDTTYHEIGKFLRLTLKANPTLIELYFMDEYTRCTNIGAGIRALRYDILSETAIRNAYHGYAYAQMREYGKRMYPKPKMARHCMRIARQGRDLLETGTTNVRVDDPQEYFDLTEKPMSDILGILLREVDLLRDCKSVLPEHPDVAKVSEFLSSVRRNNVTTRL